VVKMAVTPLKMVRSLVRVQPGAVIAGPVAQLAERIVTAVACSRGFTKMKPPLKRLSLPVVKGHGYFC